MKHTPTDTHYPFLAQSNAEYLALCLQTAPQLRTMVAQTIDTSRWAGATLHHVGDMPLFAGYRLHRGASHD